MIVRRMNRDVIHSNRKFIELIFVWLTWTMHGTVWFLFARVVVTIAVTVIENARGRLSYLISLANVDLRLTQCIITSGFALNPI
jgi:hypothetical protein